MIPAANPELVSRYTHELGSQLARSVLRGLRPIGDALTDDPERAAALWGSLMEDSQTLIRYRPVSLKGVGALSDVTASDWRAILKELGTMAEGITRLTVLTWARRLPVKEQAAFVRAICRAVEAIKDGGSDTADRPLPVRVSTSLEAAAASAFLCDLATHENFRLDTRDMRVIHERKGAAHRMVLQDCDFDEFGEHRDMSDADRRLRLIDLLAHYPGGRDSVLVAAYALGRLLAEPVGRVDLTLGELLRMDGVLTNRSGASKREQWEKALAYDGAFRAIHKWEVWGRRPWRDGEVVSQSHLLHYDGRSYGLQKPLPGMVGIPKFFTLRDSDLTERLRDTSQGQSADGLLSLAQLPRQRLQGDWAASVGLAVMYFVRVEGGRTGGTIRKTRRTLLTKYAPNTLPETLLGSDTPQRAVKAMSGALRELARIGLIKPAEEPNEERGRYWAQKWLDAPVSITAAGDLAAHAARLHASTQIAATPKRRKGGGR